MILYCVLFDLYDQYYYYYHYFNCYHSSELIIVIIVIIILIQYYAHHTMRHAIPMGTRMQAQKAFPPPWHR